MEEFTIAQELNRRRVKTPPAVIYPTLLRIWQLLYYKRLGVKVEYKIDVKKLKGPFVVISNHASRMDYIYTAIPFLPHRLNFVAGYNEFFRSHLHGIFKIAQAIPKRNFTTDLHAVREIKRVLNDGGKIIFFPEGMNSITGAQQPCAAGTGRFLRFLNVPVYYVKIRGGFLTTPKYNSDIRPGKVFVTVDELFTPERLASMTDDEAQAAVDTALYNDDYEFNKTARVAYRAKSGMAHGIHTLLYTCPSCGREFSMRSDGSRVYCSVCGCGAEMNEYGELIPFEGSQIPETPVKWVQKERETVRKLVEDPDFSLSEHVRLGTLPEHEYLKNQATSNVTGEGMLTLDRAGLHFDGVNDGEKFSFTVELKNLPTYGMCTDISRFYTFHKGIFYEFYPDGETVWKWFLCTEELYRRNNSHTIA